MEQIDKEIQQINKMFKHLNEVYTKINSDFLFTDIFEELTRYQKLGFNEDYVSSTIYSSSLTGKKIHHKIMIGNHGKSNRKTYFIDTKRASKKAIKELFVSNDWFMLVGNKKVA